MAIFLGIDGGGSKTACAVGDESVLLATAVAGASNVIRAGEDQARQSLGSVIREACAASAVDPSHIRGACLGMAGAARPEVQVAIRRLAAELIPGKIEVVGDMEIALEAAFGDGPGVVVIAGTGSIAYGRNAEGQTARAGGWGFAVSDEGSGHWISRRAIAAALRQEDKSQSSALMDGILQFWQVGREQLITVVNATPPPDFAGLLPLVTALADSGEQSALRILADAGVELAGLAKVVIHRLFPDAIMGAAEEVSRAAEKGTQRLEPELSVRTKVALKGQASAAAPAFATPAAAITVPTRMNTSPMLVPVAMSGGVFRHCGLVRDNFASALRSDIAPTSVCSELADPLLGALQRARRLFA